jgi:hypothetical protein
MTKKVTKLLAVVALATSPVAADPAPVRDMGSDSMSRTAVDPWAGTAMVRVATATAAATPAGSTFSLTALVELVARPRLMPSGAPACGNVASRAPRPADCGRSKP